LCHASLAQRYMPSADGTLYLFRLIDGGPSSHSVIMPVELSHAAVVIRDV
jgi:hypothetical protein